MTEGSRIPQDFYGEPWGIDAPAAEQNLSRRIKTATAIQVEDPILLTLDDPRLFEYPWIYFVEPSSMRMADSEVPILREFLLRGGTAMVDDFHGPLEWDAFIREMKRLFPDREIVEVPKDHPVFSSFYKIDGYPQVAGLGSFLAGRTWERGGVVPAPAHDPRRHRAADGVHQLEHRHGRRLGMVERRGVSRLHQIHRDGVSHGHQRDRLRPHALRTHMDSSVATVSAEKVAEGRERILAELRKVIVGQDEVVEQVLIALFTGGHCLITGVPGLAKTLLIKTLADILDLDFKRIQFTPDLMPSDITGTEILDEEQGTRRLRFVKGPIFAQIILADEINRTPPKTQAALLEAMQEYHVTAAAARIRSSGRSSCWRRRTPSSWKARTRCRKRSSIASCSTSSSRYLSEDDEVTVVTQTTGAERADAGARAERPGHPAVPGAGAAGRDRRRDRALHRAARERVAPDQGRREGRRPGVHRQMGEVGRRACAGRRRWSAARRRGR